MGGYFISNASAAGFINVLGYLSPEEAKSALRQLTEGTPQVIAQLTLLVCT